jgi:hypothetical protein
MTEIKKITKASLITLSIVWFIFGVLEVFLLDYFITPTTGWNNPLSPRMFGGILFVGSVFAIILLTKKTWEEIKLTYAFLFAFFFATIPIELIVAIIYRTTVPPEAITQTIIDQVIMCSLFTLGIVSYVMQERKSN